MALLSNQSKEALKSSCNVLLNHRAKKKKNRKRERIRLRQHGFALLCRFSVLLICIGYSSWILNYSLLSLLFMRNCQQFCWDFFRSLSLSPYLHIQYANFILIKLIKANKKKKFGTNQTKCVTTRCFMWCEALKIEGYMVFFPLWLYIRYAIFSTAIFREKKNRRLKMK